MAEKKRKMEASIGEGARQVAKQLGVPRPKFARLPIDLGMKIFSFCKAKEIATALGASVSVRSAVGLQTPSTIGGVRLRIPDLVFGGETEQLWRNAVEEGEAEETWLGFTRFVQLVRHDARTLVSSDARWLRKMLPSDEVFFPRLHTMDLTSFGLSNSKWHTLLQACPLVVNLRLYEPVLLDLDDELNWNPDDLLKNRNWEVLVVESVAASPATYIDAAHPNTVKLSFGAPGSDDLEDSIEAWESTPAWRELNLRQLTAKWQGHGDRLQHLLLGSHFARRDMDKMLLLLATHFPNLQKFPCVITKAVKLSTATLRLMYKNWSFLTRIPLSRDVIEDWSLVDEKRHAIGPESAEWTTHKPVIVETRSPLVDFLDSPNFSSPMALKTWTLADVLNLITKTTRLQRLHVTKPNQEMEEKTLRKLFESNHELQRAYLYVPCPVTDETLLSIAAAAKKLVQLHLGHPEYGNRFTTSYEAKDVRLATLQALLNSMNESQESEFMRTAVTMNLHFGVLTSITADDWMTLTRWNKAKQITTVECIVPLAVAREVGQRVQEERRDELYVVHYDYGQVYDFHFSRPFSELRTPVTLLRVRFWN